ncbi:MAG: glycosyltransferase family protein [Bacteroidales bacterium]|jgi:uncharacterized protein (TIGR00661 family)
MKYLFIIQGEGRGHLTQAISLSSILRKNGHEVVGALVGKNKERVIPKFFYDKIGTEVITYNSPNFVWNKAETDVKLFQTVVFNMTASKFRDYNKSMDLIHNEIKEREPDVVINFYELLAGLTNLRYNEQTPFISMAHQYLIMHSQYPFRKMDNQNMLYLKLNTFLSSYGSSKKLGLSFYDMEEDTNNNISIVPPLLRDEVLKLKPTQGDYILTYIVVKGFAEEIMKWHYENPEQKLHVFWDKSDESEETKIDDTLTFHKINDIKFLEYLANCKAFVTTAGFESVCEAMYLNKSIMMIPTHVEQKINSLDAESSGIGIASNDFNISKILNLSNTKSEGNKSFNLWIESAESQYLNHLTTISKPNYIKRQNNLINRSQIELLNFYNSIRNENKHIWSNRYWL